MCVTGCAGPAPHQVPFSVAMLPADCRNRQIMLDWLQRQAEYPRATNQNQQDYERTRNEIRKKIWDIRYHCQSV